MQRTARAALVSLMLVATLFACSESDDASNAQGADGSDGTEMTDASEDIAASGVFSEMPFAEVPIDDFVVDEVMGFEEAREHLLVAFTDDASEADASAAIGRVGGTLAGALGEARIALVKLPAGLSDAERRDALAALQADATVSAALFDVRLRADVVPATSSDTPSWQWSPPLLSGGNWGSGAMGMPIAWNLAPIVDAVGTVAGAPSRVVPVGVIDAVFQQHPDLAAMTLASGSWGSPTAVLPTGGGWHGTAVAGLIGAAWDGRFIDGVSPKVSMVASKVGGVFGNTSQVASASFASVVSSAWAQLRAATRPRLVNMSLGFNHDSQCYTRRNGVVRRCDPRQGTTQWGTPAPDSDCDGPTVRAVIDASGHMFAQLATAAQRSGPVMFVVSAGNDSDPYAGNYCVSPATVGGGLGPLPALWNSPMAYAALQLGQPDILVVEAATAVESMSRTVQRAFYSNIDAHLIAPGDAVDCIVGGGASATVLPRGCVGTSFATPLVTGAAAWLLALDPTLSNADLRRVLTSVTPAAIAGTSTRARLFLPTMIEAMEVALPTPAGAPVERRRGAKLLADMDDGTSDGFLRQGYDAVGRPTGEHTGRRDYTLVQQYRVDMADFRYLRDSALVSNRYLTCPAAVPACDLNRDGTHDNAEPFGRAYLVWPPPASPVDPKNIAKLAAQWDGDPVQGYRADELERLVNSVDITFLAGAFIERAGATSVAVTLEGTPGPGGATVPAERLTDIVVGADPTVTTTPNGHDIVITVRIVGGPKDGRTFTGSIADLGPGGDAVLYVNPCVLEDGSELGIFSPYSEDCKSHADDPDVVEDTSDASDMSDAADTTGDIDADGFIDPTCANLAATPDVTYLCFTIGGGGFAQRVVALVKPNEQGLARSYFYNGWSFIRIQGLSNEDEFVNMDLEVFGNTVTADDWEPEGSPYAPSVLFYDPDYPFGEKRREWHPLTNGQSTGVTTLTRYDAVGGFIEGRLSGEGKLRQRLPTEAEFEPVVIEGSFRVIREADH